MTELDTLCDEFADLVVKEFKMVELMKNGGRDPKARAVHEAVEKSLLNRVGEIGDKIYELTK